MAFALQMPLQLASLPRLLALMLFVLLTACSRAGEDVVATQQLPSGDAQSGWQALQDYGCHSCHVIPGVPGANGHVGPPLTAWADRHYIAGTLPNQAAYLIQWVRFPQAIEPGTAMPNMGVTEQDAQDIAAYLYTLEADEGWVSAVGRYWRLYWQ